MRSLGKNLDNITHSSDWKATKVPSMQQLDSLQRCYICKEFLQAPVVTSCNHTFCSSCIRQHLMVKNSCPLCLSTQLETNLRREVVLEEIVTCYSSLRPFLLEFLTPEANDADATQMNIEPKRKLEREDSIETVQSSPPVQLSSSTDLSSSTEEMPLKKQKMKNEVECPVCQRTMDATFLQTTHITQCLKGKCVLPKAIPETIPIETKKKPKNEISSFFKGIKPKKPDVNDALKINHEHFYFNDPASHRRKENKIPKLDFGSLTLPKLKEKLASVNIPTTGTRHQLELRYNQYYILHNSNLDSNHPVDIRVIRSRLSKWESSHSAFNSGTTSTLFSNSGSNSISNRSITDKKFSTKEWTSVYYHDFKELTKQALSNRKPNTTDGTISTEVEKITQNPGIHNQPNTDTNPLFIGDD